MKKSEQKTSENQCTSEEVDDIFGIGLNKEKIEEPEEKKSPELFKDILPSINQKTGNLFDAGLLENNQYPAYMINKAFSFGADSIHYANEMNKRPDLDNKMQYDFYYYALDKSKRYNKWIKEKEIEDIGFIEKYFNCSFKKAREYMAILTEEQVTSIKEKLTRGTDN